MTLPVTKDEIILYFNIAILAVIALFALIGFIRGTRKSIYYMIATLIVLVGGWFLADTICNILLDIDLSSMGQTFPVGEEEYELTTIRELMTNVVRDQVFGGTMPEDSLILETVFAVIIMALRIIYFFALILLSFTLFKLIFDIIWLIIRPKKRKKDGTKRKLSFGSRVGGLGIGAAKGLIYALLLCFMIAGVTSITSNISQLQEKSSDTTDTYTVIIINDTATLVKLSAEGEGESNDFLNEYSEIIDTLGFYKQTIAGQVFGSIKIGEAGIDEYVFDELFALKIKDGETTHDIKLRKELQHAANALVKIDGLLTGEFTMETLTSMDKDVLGEVIDELTSLEIINVAIPVGIEILMTNESMLEGIENESLRSAVRNSLSGLRGLDYNAELKEIGYVFVDVVQILQFDAEGALDMDFLNLDPDTVEEIFEKLGKLGLVDVVAPLFVEYLCSLESLQESFSDLGINIDELIHPENYDPNAEPISWSDEISNIGKVYKAFVGLGLKTEDFEEMNFQFTDENIAAVDNLVDQIFNSRVISRAIPVLVDVGKAQMPEEFATILAIPDTVDWSEELKPLLKSALVLFSSGLFSEEGEMTDKLAALSDEKIEQLAEYFSQSKIIKTNLSGLIDQFLAPSEGSEGVFGDITLVSLDSIDDWTKTEIASIFKAIKLIIDSGIIGSDDIFKTFSELSDETVNNLAADLSSSKFIRKNLSNILKYFLEQMSTGEDGLTLVSLDENDWTKTELSSIFFALIDIAKSGMLNSEGTDGIKDLSDELIDSLGTHISASKFLRTNLTEIMDMLLSSIDLGEGIEIKGFEDANLWTKVEIVSLLKSARLIVNYTDDLTRIINVTEDELDVLTGSRLITNTLVSFIKAYSKPGESLEIVKGADMIEDDEWYDIDTKTTFTLIGSNLTISSTPNTNKYYIYVDGKKVASTESTIYDLSTIDGINPTTSNTEVYAKDFGEIRKMFVSIQTLIGEDFNTETIGDDIVSSLTKLDEAKILKIIDSKLIAETIICKIEEFTEGDNAFISIPEGELTKLNLDGSKDRSAWHEQGETHGELFKLLRAVAVLFGGENLGDEGFNFSTDLITNIDDDDIHKITESLVINETLIQKIEDMAEEDNATIYIPTELLEVGSTRIDRDAWMDEDETGNLLYALKAIFNGGSVDVEHLCIEPIINEKDEILKSLVICETVKKQITKPETSMAIPTELSGDDLSGWKNEYYDTGELKSTGELSDLLSAVEIILGLTSSSTTEIGNVKTDNIKLANIIEEENQNVILKSKVVTQTVKNQITSGDTGIVIPEVEELSNENLDGWANVYEGTNDVPTKRGEVAKLLSAVGIILNITPSSDTSIDGVKTDDIKLQTVIDNKDEILKSLVITATIKDKIEGMDEKQPGGSLPITKYNTGLDDFDSWKNEYDGEDVKHGEISALLDAISIVLHVDSNTKLDDFSTDSINLGNIVYEKDTILKSIIITSIIREKIEEDISSLSVPTKLRDVEDLTYWKSEYDAVTGEVESYGEIAKLLTSIKYVLGIKEDDDSNFNDINVDNIKISTLVTNRQTILRSEIISATVKEQVLDNASTDDSKLLRLPAGYLNVNSNNYISWYNEYNDTTYDEEKKEFNFTVTSVGEIDKLLAAIGELLADSDVSFEDIGAFNYTNLFKEGPQAKLISSKLISETIIQKINENALSIPNDPSLKLNDNTDRTAWWDTSNGELKYFLNGIGLILGDSDKENLNVDLDVSSVYKNITNETKRTELFKSYLIAETLTVNFATLDLFKDSIPTYANSGLDLKATNTDGSDDRTDWYVIDTSGETRTIEEKELWQLITSIHILLGDNFDVNKQFSIDQVLANEYLEPDLNPANKVNKKAEHVADLLASKIIEEVFRGVIEKLLTGTGPLAPYLTLPVSPNWYLYTTPTGQEHDTKTIIESIYQMQKSGLSYSAVKEIANAGFAGALTVYNTLKNLKTGDLADAFVISRTYQGSIEQFFNGMLGDIYTAIYNNGGAFVGMQSWNDVKLVQGDYDALINDKVAMSALLKTNIDNIISNIEKAAALLGA